MRPLWLLVLVSLTAEANDHRGRFERFCGRSTQGRSNRGFLCDDQVFFEFAPVSNLGMGTACACTTPTTPLGTSLTFTRASVDECYSNDGQTLTQCAANQPVISSGSATSSWLGLWSYPAATNLALHNRDLSQAIWTKTTMTCALTATGMRGAANSASTCTASAGNGTVIQATVTGAATRNTSFHIKRRTGTGVVEVTRDNGATWTAITASLSSTLWRRVVSVESPGCAGGNCIVVAAMTSGIANPTFGIRLGTNGDAVDVDFVQDEAGTDPTTPILTGAASANRSEPTAYVTTTAFQPRSLRAYGTVAGLKPQYAGLITAYQDATNRTWLNQGATVVQTDQYMQCYWRTGVDNVANSSVFLPPTFGGVVSHGCNYDGTTGLSSIHGYQQNTALSFTPPASVTRIYIGSLEVAANTWRGVVKGVCASPVNGACTSSVIGNGTDVAMIGDSITRSDTSAPTRVPLEVSKITRKVVMNDAVSGETAAQCATRFNASVANKGYATTVIFCWVNSLNNGVTAAATFVSLQAMADAARAEGQKVVMVRTSPWATYSGWTAGKQTETDALWVLQQAYCSTYSSSTTCVDTASLGTGSPLQLQAGYDYGDGLHLNAAGAVALAALIAAAIP